MRSILAGKLITLPSGFIVMRIAHRSDRRECQWCHVPRKRELMKGFTAGYTVYVGSGCEQAKLIGNVFHVETVAHWLGELPPQV